MEKNFFLNCFQYRAFFFMFIYGFQYLISFLLKKNLLCKLKFEILAPELNKKKVSAPALAPAPAPEPRISSSRLRLPKI